MSKTPLVSVIMPLYNKRLYVKRAIDSVIKQTFADWELIIIDDGSTDGSISEIPGDEPRIRLFQQKNAGPAAARNQGIRMARGEYVTFIDADDYYYPQKLETEMVLLRKDWRAEWMVSSFNYESNNQVSLAHIRDIEGNEIKGESMVFDKALRQLKIQFWHINGICMKKKLLNQLGGFQEGMRWLEITEMQIRCALSQPRVIVCPVPLYRVIDVPDSASKVSLHRVQGIRQMGENLYQLSKEYPDFSDILKSKSLENYFSYAAHLIFSNKSAEARRFLIRNYPYERNRRWWKMWVGSWIPAEVLKRVVDVS